MKDMVQVQRSGGRDFEAPSVKIGRSQFNRSHGLKTTFDAGLLIPILVDEVLPGDTFTCSLNGYVRIFSPLDAPVMDNIELETLFFFVPTRLVWENHAFFHGAHDAAGAQDTDYTIPIMADGLTIDHDGGVAAEDLGAYFGLPDGLQTTAIEVSALPWRAYNLIYIDWFRDQNLQGESARTRDNGPDASGLYIIRRTAKKHDYFTSALPYLQKGTAIELRAPVRGIGKSDQVYGGASASWYETGRTATVVYPFDASFATTFSARGTAATGGFPEIFADIDINALRQSVSIQRLLETDARAGTRYTEMMKAHFGVTSPDSRLQRPEYLGGGKSMINVSPVANTSDTATHDQGELAGIGTGVIQGHGWAKSFVEHGYIIGLVRARGDITYFQGLDKLWSRSTRYDFFLPALANLGEQAILNKEIWISNVLATDDAVFGYQQRWEEYRSKPSRVTGIFNPDAASAISHWHLAEDFASLPALNTAFIWDSTPMDRIITVTTAHHFIMDLWFNYKCARPIPVYSIPSLIAQRF